MMKPKLLKPGDTIGIVAPASFTALEKLRSVKEALEDLGFQVKLGKSCLQKYGYLAGKDHLRAEDINDMFADKGIKGIFCLRGGYGSLRILDKLDYQVIRSNPKVFIGFSDITALHVAINQICNIITFHGPMAVQFLKGMDDFSTNRLLKLVTRSAPIGVITNPQNEKIFSLVGGQARGQIIGGNLSVLISLMGTPYEMDTRGKLLFFEEIGEEPYRVDRMLTQLALAGKLREASGFILGDWKNCESKNPEESLSLMEVFQEIFVPLGKPTIYNLQAGHCHNKVTIPLGIEGLLDGDQGLLYIEERATLE